MTAENAESNGSAKLGMVRDIPEDSRLNKYHLVATGIGFYNGCLGLYGDNGKETGNYYLGLGPNCSHVRGLILILG